MEFPISYIGAEGEEGRKTETMLEIIQAQTDEHKSQVREFFWEYLTWTNAMLNQEFKISFDMSVVLEADLSKVHQFAPPSGRLLIANISGQNSRLRVPKKD